MRFSFTCCFSQSSCSSGAAFSMMGYNERSRVTFARRHALQKVSRIALRRLPFVTMRKPASGKTLFAASMNASGVG